MGDFLTSATGTKNDYNAGNPYTDDQTNQLYGQQQQLSNLLMQQAQGGGPNPAQQQYLQNSQQIAQQQAQTYASNRSLNPGLAARMAGNTAANVAQQAAGTAGIQQAQQQLAAQGQLGSLNMGQQQLINQSRLGSQQINAGVAAGNQQMGGAILGGVIGGAGAAMSGASGMAHGGIVQSFADGGAVSDAGAPQSKVGQFFSGMGQSMNSTGSAPISQINSPIAGSALPLPNQNPSNWGAAALEKGMLSGAKLAGKAGMAFSMASQGGNIPGKASVSGDSSSNDTVPTMLSPQEIVLPRSVTMSKDAPDRAKKFVEAILARESLRNKK